MGILFRITHQYRPKFAKDKMDSPVDEAFNTSTLEVMFTGLVHTLMTDTKNFQSVSHTIPETVKRLETLLRTRPSSPDIKLQKLESQLTKNSEQITHMNTVVGQITRRVSVLEQMIKLRKNAVAEIPLIDSPIKNDNVSLGKVGEQIQKLTKLQESLQADNERSIQEGMDKLDNIVKKLDTLTVMQADEDVDEIHAGLRRLSQIEEAVKNLGSSVDEIRSEMKSLIGLSEAVLSIETM